MWIRGGGGRLQNGTRRRIQFPVSASWPRSARASANPDGGRRHRLARLNARCAHQADLCRLLDHLGSHRRHGIPAPQQVSSLPNSCACPRENATAEMRARCWRPAPATAYGRHRCPRRSIRPGPAGRDRLVRPRPGRASSSEAATFTARRRQDPHCRVTALGVAWQARASDIPAVLSCSPNASLAFGRTPRPAAMSATTGGDHQLMPPPASSAGNLVSVEISR